MTKVINFFLNFIKIFLLIILSTSGSLFNPTLAVSRYSECNINFQRGLEFFEARATGAKDWRAESQFIDSAIFHFRKSIECPETRQKSAYYFLRSLHFKAMYTDLPEADRKEIYNEAKTKGEYLAIEFPYDIGIKLWYLANAGKWIQYYGIFRAAYEGLGPKIKSTCEKIVELDPLYEKGIGYRMLGLVYYQAPYIPVILTWPDEEKGIALTQKALEIDPDNIGNLLFMGKIYFMDEQYEKARFYLKKCRKQKPREAYLIMERFDQMKAKEFLDIIDAKDLGQ